ncbi:MAG: purine-nucleoside phosphorylase [Pyrinomonadaceae bacterium]
MSYENAVEAAEYIRSKHGGEIEAVLVLGSGLGAFADELEDSVRIPYEDIPHFARSTVEGHAGQLVIGRVAGKTVAVQQGRFHYYEGYDISQVIFPMQVFGTMGIKTAIITNAAGSVITSFKPGRLMLIKDHLNMMGVSPLRGENDDRFGPRFPDMTSVYDPELQILASEEARKIAEERFEQGLEDRVVPILRRGIYCALSGPNYETPAEIRMYRLLGATAVGMSTVPEAITARHMGIRVLGISCITNLAAGITNDVIHHEEVMETGQKVGVIFKELLTRVVSKL